jgi:uncharacterized protein
MSLGCVLDACSIIAFLNDEEGAEKVEELLRQGERQTGNIFLHEINLLEIYYGIYRDEGELLAEQVFQKTLGLPLEVIHGLTEPVFREAGRLKATYGISLADSIALAEAKTRGIPLVTCDHHEFDELERKGELIFSWIR